MERRCFHPDNFSFSWDIQKTVHFTVQRGAVQDPSAGEEKTSRNLKFHCGDCGFMAYYNPRTAPHWLQGKMREAGIDYPEPMKVTHYSRMMEAV